MVTQEQIDSDPTLFGLDRLPPRGSHADDVSSDPPPGIWSDQPPPPPMPLPAWAWDSATTPFDAFQSPPSVSPNLTELRSRIRRVEDSQYPIDPGFLNYFCAILDQAGITSADVEGIFPLLHNPQDYSGGSSNDPPQLFMC